MKELKEVTGFRERHDMKQVVEIKIFDNGEFELKMIDDANPNRTILTAIDLYKTRWNNTLMECVLFCKHCAELNNREVD
jgi:3-keto-L-gulonate-6-phosphate decarboxylase